jgi:hypothetical protein
MGGSNGIQCADNRFGNAPDGLHRLLMMVLIVVVILIMVILVFVVILIVMIVIVVSPNKTSRKQH